MQLQLRETGLLRINDFSNRMFTAQICTSFLSEEAVGGNLTYVCNYWLISILTAGAAPP